MKHFNKDFYDKLDTADGHEALRAILLEVEKEIKGVVGDDPFDFYRKTYSQEVHESIHELLGKRKRVINQMFAYTDDEVKRIFETNALLKDLRKKMFQRACSLYRSVLKDRDEAFDDDYEVEGTIKADTEFDPKEGDYDSVLHLENDDFYGSDFAYMLCVVRENMEAYHSCLKCIDDCFIHFRDDHSPEMSDEELECDYKELDDGMSWDECLRLPCFEGFCFSHAFHSFFMHHKYSLPDLIRVNSYWVEVKLVCQRITDSRGRRLRDLRTEWEKEE